MRSRILSFGIWVVVPLLVATSSWAINGDSDKDLRECLLVMGNPVYQDVPIDVFQNPRVIDLLEGRLHEQIKRRVATLIVSDDSVAARVADGFLRDLVRTKTPFVYFGRISNLTAEPGSGGFEVLENHPRLGRFRVTIASNIAAVTQIPASALGNAPGHSWDFIKRIESAIPEGTFLVFDFPEEAYWSQSWPRRAGFQSELANFQVATWEWLQTKKVRGVMTLPVDAIQELRQRPDGSAIVDRIFPVELARLRP